jgi:DNA-binding protein HU-beta
VKAPAKKTTAAAKKTPAKKAVKTSVKKTAPAKTVTAKKTVKAAAKKPAAKKTVARKPVTRRAKSATPVIEFDDILLAEPAPVVEKKPRRTRKSAPPAIDTQDQPEPHAPEAEPAIVETIAEETPEF